MRIKMNMDIRVGRVVKYLVLSDLFLLAGWGLVEPLFSVFIIQKIAGATLATVGIAAAIYWTLKSVLEMPVANYLDRTPGERDDFLALTIGLVLGGFSALAFVWVDRVWELYVIQIIHAIAFALYVPSWSAIFSRHLDKDRVSFDWSLDSTVAGFAAGASGLVSGILADKYGFTSVFLMASIFSLLAALVVMFVPDIVIPKPTMKIEPMLKDHTPADMGV